MHVSVQLSPCAVWYHRNYFKWEHLHESRKPKVSVHRHAKNGSSLNDVGRDVPVLFVSCRCLAPSAGQRWVDAAQPCGGPITNHAITCFSAICRSLASEQITWEVHHSACWWPYQPAGGARAAAWTWYPCERQTRGHSQCSPKHQAEGHKSQGIGLIPYNLSCAPVAWVFLWSQVQMTPRFTLQWSPNT